LSQDIHIAHPCPHLIMEEPVSLGSDRQTMALKASVANSSGVLLLANDQTYIPRRGVSYPASLNAAYAGSYRIERCSGRLGAANNDITITTNAGSVTVSLPTGNRVQIEDVIRVLKTTTQLVSPSSLKGVLVFTETAEVGPPSFIRVSGKGSDALGFQQKGMRGREGYPPWNLYPTTRVYPAVRGPLRAYKQKVWEPKFLKPLKTNPTLKVTYVSPPDVCPRCQGTYVENDYRFNTEGGVILVKDNNLLYQMCLKAILTEKGSNPYHPGYGCTLLSRIGAKRTSTVASAMKDDVNAALLRAQDIQTQQRKYQLVSAKETLYAVNGVDVRADPNDPTAFFIDVAVQSASNTPIALSIVFTVPGAVALGGSTGLPLGLEATGVSTNQADSLFYGTRL